MAARVVLTTVADNKTAARFARALVREKLAACVTALPGATSHYRWKNKIERSREVLLLIKTDSRSQSRLEKFFRDRHPYELPELLALPVAGGSKGYLSWLQNSLK